MSTITLPNYTGNSVPEIIPPSDSVFEGYDSDGNRVYRLREEDDTLLFLTDY